MAEQLHLFTDDVLPKLNDTEEALLHFMKRCIELEEEIKDLKNEVATLTQQDWQPLLFDKDKPWIISTFDETTATTETLGEETNES